MFISSRKNLSSVQNIGVTTVVFQPTLQPTSCSKFCNILNELRLLEQDVIYIGKVQLFMFACGW